MSYIWTITATAVNWEPKNEVALPMNIRRYAGWRSGRMSMAMCLMPRRVLAGWSAC